ncbi:hypothetical protein FOQG_17506 [Fusarium oxysporum f. sp. raphani 54005]|uniref:Uncharacterized protein n=2 Tax=Fusarium oxysporum TaxID=5507 RepID=X0C4W2_FUSOX|nr:hypothetical protein FOVG_17983 [Fusarium oxysporum f. sp. pisi HDV247]EXK77802.1 hypothetical protein FOQG_17506 [Fusarium oxysporum f. sp. raphani 54005]
MEKMDDQIVKTSISSNMGRRAFTNPSKIESESERARNRRRRQQQRHQSMVHQEYSAYPGIRVINSVHSQLPREDA